MTAKPEQPECLSIIICDDIYRDEATKKLILVGTFNQIGVPSLPCMHPRMSVMFTLTNARGRQDLALSIEHEETGEQVIEMSGPFEMDDPLAILDINVVLQNLRFLRPGKHWVVLKAQGAIVCQRPFFIQVVTESG